MTIAISGCAKQYTKNNVTQSSDVYTIYHYITRHGKVDKNSCDSSGECNLNSCGINYAENVLLDSVSKRQEDTGYGLHLRTDNKNQSVQTIQPIANKYGINTISYSTHDLYNSLNKRLSTFIGNDVDNEIYVWSMKRRLKEKDGYAQILENILGNDIYGISESCPKNFNDSSTAYKYYLRVLQHWSKEDTPKLTSGHLICSRTLESIC